MLAARPLLSVLAATVLLTGFAAPSHAVTIGFQYIRDLGGGNVDPSDVIDVDATLPGTPGGPGLQAAEVTQFVLTFSTRGFPQTASLVLGVVGVRAFFEDGVFSYFEGFSVPNPSFPAIQLVPGTSINGEHIFVGQTRLTNTIVFCSSCTGEYIPVAGSAVVTPEPAVGLLLLAPLAALLRRRSLR